MTASQTTTSKGTVIGTDISGFLVRDPQAMIAFYRDKLGMEPTAIDDEGRGAEFTLSDGSTFGVWKTESGETGGFTMLAVDDIHAAREAMTLRGLEISPVDESPVCHMAFGKDPEGNTIIIHQRKHRD
ncbi:MAG TPA: VOC family protein [Candidatus Baltobacteraceae bacterium]|jgi:predicted enzyme related to lactoylglutathione lyase|nr:VOC family protein [Candidatus Baltobacteraceae bacterium]